MEQRTQAGATLDRDAAEATVVLTTRVSRETKEFFRKKAESEYRDLSSEVAMHLDRVRADLEEAAAEQ